MIKTLTMFRFLGAAVIVAAAALAACGGDSKDDEEESSSASSSTQVAGRTLSDCDYAKQLAASLGRFTNSVTALPTSPGSKEDANKTFAAIDADISQTIAELKSYKLSGDMAKVNSGMVAIFEDFKRQIPEIKTAAETGNAAKVAEITAKIDTNFATSLDKIQKENKATIDKLDKCAV